MLWFKYFSEGGETMTMKQEGGWVRLLKIAARCGNECGYGNIGVTEKMGFTFEQMAHMMRITRKEWVELSRFFVQNNMVIIGPDGVITIVKWQDYQGEYLRVREWKRKRERNNGTGLETPKKKKEEEEEEEEELKNKQKIYQWWQAMEHLPKHKPPAPHEKGMTKALEAYSLEEIQQAISNYNAVMGLPKEYWFSYKWALGEFCSRGVIKFTDSVKPLENFKIKGGNNGAYQKGNGIYAGAATPKPGKYAHLSE